MIAFCDLPAGARFRFPRSPEKPYAKVSEERIRDASGQLFEAYPDRIVDDAPISDAEWEASWAPMFSPWRHGGWYVDNVHYPSGAVGCVSRGYLDKKWRIVCADQDGITYGSRDAAARAERALTLREAAASPRCSTTGCSEPRGSGTSEPQFDHDDLCWEHRNEAVRASIAARRENADA